MSLVEQRPTRPPSTHSLSPTNTFNDPIVSIDHKANERDVEEFPEGGLGWLVIAGTFVIMATSFGMINTFGEFQNYYLTVYPNEQQSILTLIGSLQAFSVYFFSIPSSIILKRFGPRLTVFGCGLVVSFSFMMTSLCTEVWQLALSQGILFGAATSAPVLVCYWLPQQWFKKKRAMALGIMSSGSSLAGIVWPIAIQHLIKEVGFAWANRILGFIYLPLITFEAYAMIPRDHKMARRHDTTPVIEPQEQHDLEKTHDTEQTRQEQVEDQEEVQSPEPTIQKSWLRRNIFHRQFIIDWTVLHDYRFCLILLANFIGYFGLFVPLFFIPSFSNLINISSGVKNNILTISNSSSIFGRILPGILGDKIGRLNMFIFAVGGCGLFVLCFWLPAAAQENGREALDIVTALLYGITSGAFFALPPAVIGQLFGVNGVSSRVSMYMLVCAPGALLGNVIAGSFLPTGRETLGSDPDPTRGYPKLMIFSGAIFFASVSVLIITRCCFTRKFFAFV